jgi:hypothetical protein
MAVLAVAVLVTYHALSDCGFISYDDPTYVSENSHVLTGLSGTNFRWAWATTDTANWHPLTWLSLQLDAQLFGRPAWGFHRTNLLLHLANALVLFVLFRHMTGAVWRSAVVAGLFAVHPLHVESVAWVAERKDVLSTFFGLLAILAYARYERAPGVGAYLPVALCLALSLLAKPMFVTLPAVLLLLDFWPLGRWRVGGAAAQPAVSPRRLVLEKVPLVILAAASCAATVWAQGSASAIRPLMLIPLPERLGNALASYAAYLVQTFVPLHLAPFYPHPRGTLDAGTLAQAAVLLAGITTLVLLRGRRFPYLPVGWFWYLGTLVPVIGLVQVGDQARADRYTYVPLVGIFVMLTWGVADLARRLRWEKPMAVVAAAALALLAWAASLQVGYWQNDLVLWRHAVEVTPPSAVAYNCLGLALMKQHDLKRAHLLFDKAVGLAPEEPGYLKNLAYCLYNLQKFDEAAACLRRYLDREPNPIPQPYLYLADAYAAVGKFPEAADAARQALERAGGHPALEKESRERVRWYEQGRPLPARGRPREPGGAF